MEQKKGTGTSMGVRKPMEKQQRKENREPASEPGQQFASLTAPRLPRPTQVNSSELSTSTHDPTH